MPMIRPPAKIWEIPQPWEVHGHQAKAESVAARIAEILDE